MCSQPERDVENDAPRSPGRSVVHAISGVSSVQQKCVRATECTCFRNDARLIAMHDANVPGLAERHFDVAVLRLEHIAILHQPLKPATVGDMAECRSASRCRFPRCENGAFS